MSAQIYTQPSFSVESIHPMFQLDFPYLPGRTLLLYDVSARRPAFRRAHR